MSLPKAKALACLDLRLLTELAWQCCPGVCQQGQGMKTREGVEKGGWGEDSSCERGCRAFAEGVRRHHWMLDANIWVIQQVLPMSGSKRRYKKTKECWLECPVRDGGSWRVEGGRIWEPGVLPPGSRLFLSHQRCSAFTGSLSL